VKVIMLALAASGFTAMASVAQRQAAAPAPGELSFNWRLVGYLLHRPLWFIGIACMIFGFLFQIEALRIGSLSLVQPLIAAELVLVFGIIALANPHRVQARDWLAALGMALGLAAFLVLAKPTKGHLHASPSMWVVSGLSAVALAGLLSGLASRPGRAGPGGNHKAALLGVAAAVMFGIVAAVIKELSTHLSQGLPGLLTTWSPYVLLLSGAVAMYLASNAFQAGSLAASQPALTIVDPLVACVLGAALFGERLDLRPLAVTGELTALITLVASVMLLSRSPLVVGEPSPLPGGSVGPVPADRVPAGPMELLHTVPRYVSPPADSALPSMAVAGEPLPVLLTSSDSHGTPMGRSLHDPVPPCPRTECTRGWRRTVRAETSDHG
jgi:drug/metabolite transporter (DMT)-like permease